jgi:hypothetical protein
MPDTRGGKECDSLHQPEGRAPALAVTDREGRVDLSVFFSLTPIQFPKRFARIVRSRRGCGRRSFVDFDVASLSAVDLAAFSLRIANLTRYRGFGWRRPRSQRLFRDVLALGCCNRPRGNSRR